MNLIVAVDQNWAIGKDGRLLVNIPADRQLFMKETTGKTVVMGRKTLESAIANARVKADKAGEPFRENDLYIKETYVDEGVTLKRFRARAQGRAARINKRTSHITVVVANKEGAR